MRALEMIFVWIILIAAISLGIFNGAHRTQDCMNSGGYLVKCIGKALDE